MGALGSPAVSSTTGLLDTASGPHASAQERWKMTAEARCIASIASRSSRHLFHRALCRAEIRALPASVFGPVLAPP
jgi:hypothetical protein